MGDGLVPGCRGDTTGGRTDAPPGVAEAVATARHDDGGRIDGGEGDGGIDVRHTGGGRQQAVEEGLDGNAVGVDVGADGVTRRRVRTRGRCGQPEGEHGATGVGGEQGVEGPRRGRWVGDDDRVQRLTEGGLHGGLPSCVDAHEVEQRADHADGVGQALGTGPGTGGVEGQLQPLEAGDRRGSLLGRRTVFLGGPLVGAGQLVAAGRGPLDVGDQRRLDELARLGLVAQLGDRGIELGDASSQLGGPVTSAQHLGLGPLGGRPPRAQLATHLGDGTRRGRSRRRTVERAATLLLEALLLGDERLGIRAEGEVLGAHGGELLGVPGGVVLQAGDHPGVEQPAAVALDRPAALDDDGAEAAGPLAQLLDRDEAVADVVGAARRQLGAGHGDLGVQPGQLALERDLPPAQVELGAGEGGEPGAQPGDLPPGDVDAQRRQLADQLAVPAGGLRLALERTQLAAHLAQEVLHAQQVGLGGVEAALGLLLALAVLEDAGGLLDDGPAVLRPGVEDGVDLALADDDVLLASDAGIGQELLHVEQPAGHVVDGVLAVARAEQRATDGDLAEVDGEDARRVVDGQAHLGAAQRRPGGGAGEDDVVHLLAAHGAGRLGAEHPGDGVDDVRLARPVGSDDDGDARLELQRRGLGERLEALEGQALQEHGASEATGSPPRTSGIPAGLAVTPRR